MREQYLEIAEQSLGSPGSFNEFAAGLDPALGQDQKDVLYDEALTKYKRAVDPSHEKQFSVESFFPRGTFSDLD